MPDKKPPTVKASMSLSLSDYGDLCMLKTLADDFGFWGENYDAAAGLLEEVIAEDKGEALAEYIIDNWPFRLQFDDKANALVTVSGLLLFLDNEDLDIRKALKIGEDDDD